MPCAVPSGDSRAPEVVSRYRITNLQELIAAVADMLRCTNCPPNIPALVKCKVGIELVKHDRSDHGGEYEINMPKAA